jgi:hypothetical protein
MDADQAYKTALYYVDGLGRGRTWIRALADQDEFLNNAPMAISPERETQSLEQETPGRQEVPLLFLGQSAWPIGHE